MYSELNIKQLDSWDDFVSAGVQVREDKDDCQWIIGDLSNELTGRPVRGRPNTNRETQASYARDIGIARQTLNRYASNSRFYDNALRGAFALPYRHWDLARRAAKGDVAVAVEWLEKANDGNWSVERFVARLSGNGTDVWEPELTNMWRFDYPAEGLPVGMPKNVLYHWTNEGDTVADATVASISVFAACEQMDRNCVTFLSIYDGGSAHAIFMELQPAVEAMEYTRAMFKISYNALLEGGVLAVLVPALGRIDKDVSLFDYWEVLRATGFEVIGRICCPLGNRWEGEPEKGALVSIVQDLLIARRLN